MLDLLRIESTSGARLKGVLAALMLVAGCGAALASNVTVDLCATTGTVALPAAPGPIKVFGYASGACAETSSVTAPGGPVIYASVGDTVQVNLSNKLPHATGLLFQGQAMVPDTQGAAAATVSTYGTKTYTFTATSPGTFLYEAAPLPNAEHQAAMGLHGALIVRPASVNQAYGAAATAFDDEAVLVLSEVDPALNDSADPTAFDMRDYAPRYFLINGRAYPDTAPIASEAGRKLLLRYVNAGARHHSMAVLGLRQVFVARDASPLPTLNHNVVAETLAPGQTADAIATVPASATTASKFAVYDGSLMLHNNGASGFGGMLTFVTAGTGTVESGPVTGAVAVTPNPTNGSISVYLSASVNSPSSPVSAAEYFIDTVGASGTGSPMTGSFGSTTGSVSATLSPTRLEALAAGNHAIYVHAKDAADRWGGFSSGVVKLDKAGPATAGLTLTPNPSNGTVSVALSASADDSATGNSNVAAAEYAIDGGAPVAMSVNVSAPIASVSATIPAGLAPGAHAVTVRSQDAMGNWGAPAGVTLNVVTAGPATSGVSASKNPNNGALPLSASQPVVRVTATMTAGAGTTVVGAEGFIDSVGANGSGFPFTPSDGLWNSATESGRADIPLATINALSAGNHTVYVRGRDAAGNWGSTGTTILVIDKAAPTVSGVTLTPSTTNAAAVAIGATASDTATGNSNIVAAEYFIDSVGAAGTGAPMTTSAAAPTASLSATISATTIGGLAEGSHAVYVHARDAAGNWGSTVSSILLIERTAPTISSVVVVPPPYGATTTSATVTAADNTGGSGLNGGEYWIDGTATPPATGVVAFAGTSSPITVSGIDVSGLTAGTHTLRVRVKDGAGNFSAVSSQPFTVVADAIFANGFEAATAPWGWTSRSTTNTARLNRTAASALAGSWGLQAQGNNNNFVQYDFGTTANPATGTFDARFYFNPNGNTGSAHEILLARTAGGAAVFRVRYRWNGGGPQVQIQFAGSTANSAWTNLTNNAANRIEVVWQAGASLALHVNGTLSQTLPTTNTSTVGQVRLGAVTSGGSATLEYFDAFAAKRSTSPLIGP